MSLADDQILNDSHNALDELSRRVNAAKGPIKAAEEVIKFEAELEMAEKEEKKDVVKPKKTVINQEELLRGIREDMSR